MICKCGTEMAKAEGGRMITIAEYISWKQPEVAAMLWSVIKQVFAFSLPFETWKVIMEEPPLPGRAGVLSGEEVVG